MVKVGWKTVYRLTQSDFAKMSSWGEMQIYQVASENGTLVTGAGLIASPAQGTGVSAKSPSLQLPAMSPLVPRVRVRARYTLKFYSDASSVSSRATLFYLFFKDGTQIALTTGEASTSLTVPPPSVPFTKDYDLELVLEGKKATLTLREVFGTGVTTTSFDLADIPNNVKCAVNVDHLYVTSEQGVHAQPYRDYPSITPQPTVITPTSGWGIVIYELVIEAYDVIEDIVTQMVSALNTALSLSMMVMVIGLAVSLISGLFKRRKRETAPTQAQAPSR